MTPAQFFGLAVRLFLCVLVLLFHFFWLPPGWLPTLSPVYPAEVFVRRNLCVIQLPNPRFVLLGYATSPGLA